MPDLATHLGTMAAYNRWANRRLYAAAAALPDDDYRRPAGAYFGSLHGTLNHLLVVDRNWMARFEGTGEAQHKLNAILFERLDELRAAREREDERIVGHVAGLAAAISRVARDPRLARQRAVCAAALVARDFDVDASARRLVGLFSGGAR